MNFKTVILILGLLCGIKLKTLAQMYGYDAFSSCNSLCNSSTYFAALNNPAEMCNSKTTLSYSISNPYGLKDLYSSGFNFQTASKQMAMGVIWQNEGNSAYQLNQVGLCIALKPLKEIRIGLKGTIEYLNISKYARRKSANLDASISTQVNPKIKSCFIIKNILNLKTSPSEGQNQIVQWGIGCAIEKRIQLLLEVEKSVRSSIRFKSAISIQKDSSFHLNICSSNAGKQLGLGIGIKKKKTELGFAFNAHIILGFSTCISIAYEIKS
jgi:hypothetical protein